MTTKPEENVIDFATAKADFDAKEEARLRELIDNSYGRWYYIHAKEEDNDNG